MDDTYKPKTPMSTSTNEIREDLMFPKVGAALYVSQPGDFPQAGGWYIHLHIFGPDFRFNPASILIYSHNVQKLYQVLQEAHTEMQRLERENPSEATSDFKLQTRRIDSRLSLYVSFNDLEYLKKPEEKVSLCFGISSRTQTFRRSCTTQEVQTMLTKLEAIEERVATLKQLSLELPEPVAAKH